MLNGASLLPVLLLIMYQVLAKKVGGRGEELNNTIMEAGYIHKLTDDRENVGKSRKGA